MVCLFCISDPHGGDERRDGVSPQLTAAVIAFLGDRVSQIEEWREWVQNNLDKAWRSRRESGLGLVDVRPRIEGFVPSVAASAFWIMHGSAQYESQGKQHSGLYVRLAGRDAQRRLEFQRATGLEPIKEWEAEADSMLNLTYYRPWNPFRGHSG